MAQGNKSTTRGNVDDNPAVESTRVHVAGSGNDEGQELNSNNVVELTTENDVAKRNLDHGREGRDNEDGQEAEEQKSDSKARGNDRKSK